MGHGGLDHVRDLLSASNTPSMLSVLSPWLDDPGAAGAPAYHPLPHTLDLSHSLPSEILASARITALVSEVIHCGIWAPTLMAGSLSLPFGRIYPFMEHINPKQWGYFPIKHIQFCISDQVNLLLAHRKYILWLFLKAFPQPNMVYFLLALIWYFLCHSHPIKPIQTNTTVSLFGIPNSFHSWFSSVFIEY